MSTEESPKPVKRRRWLRRCLVTLAWLAGLTIFALVGGAVYVSHVVKKTLNDAVAEADRIDPGWRLDEVLAKREVLPDETNSALQVLAACKAIPSDWRFRESKNKAEGTDESGMRGLALYESLRLADPSVTLTRIQDDTVREEVRRVRMALDLAHALAHYPKGRYPIDWRPDLFSIPLEHVRDARDVARLLDFDALARAQEGDSDGALESCRAIINVGRSFGDEPFMLSHLVRTPIATMAADAVERALAQGESNDELLATVQKALTEEYGERLDLLALRGDRALFFEFLHRLDSGVPCDSLKPKLPFQAIGIGPADHLLYRYNQGLSLSYFNRAVAAAHQPYLVRTLLVENLASDFEEGRKHDFTKYTGLFTYFLFPNINLVVRSEALRKARLGTAAVMVAAERFRKARGRWPKSTKEIEDELVVRLPRDPYVEAPFLVQSYEDGIVVYSVGPDRLDNQATLVTGHPESPNTDIGYRLWDVANRRRAPEP